MQSVTLPARRRVVPVVTLLVLSPIIVEFLFGSTHISMLYLLIPQIGVYGCGALLIRALVRYRDRSWFAILLLGLAFAITLECVILQTSFAPLPFALYGRALGVNWVYLLFQLGYESIWAIVLPIQLTELLFPSRRDDPWLGRWGLAITAIVFLLASIATWYLFRLAIPKFLHGTAYQTPLLAIGIALAVIALLVVAALGPWSSSRPRRQAARPVPWPWLVGLVAFVLALLWFVLAILSAGVAPSLPAVIPIVIGLAWAAVAFLVVRHWSASSAWQDTHRLALVFGALVASMLVGFVASGTVLPTDLIGKLVLNVIAVLGLSSLAWRLHRRRQLRMSEIHS
jgi:hypothetical protein